MKNIFILISILFFQNLKASNFENEIILIEVTEPYGNLEITKKYYLLEPSNSKDSVIRINNLNYKVFLFEIPIIPVNENCCKDNKFRFIGNDGEPMYSMFLKKNFRKKDKKRVIKISKLKINYCLCLSYYSNSDLYCIPKSIIYSKKIKRKEGILFYKSIVKIESIQLGVGQVY